MRVVYSPVHLGHEIRTQTIYGVQVPGQRGRGARRAHPRHPRGRRRLRARRADGARRGPDHRRPRSGPARVPARGLARDAAGRDHPGLHGPGDHRVVPRLRGDVRRRPPRAAAHRRPVRLSRARHLHPDRARDVRGGAVRRRRRPDHRRPRARRRDRAPTGCAGRPGTTRRGRCTAATATSTTRRSRPRRSSGRTGEPVAILDLDYHHGNGTEQIFWRRGDVLYVSLHADPERQYPYFLGRADETGEGPGAGANLNLPLPAGLTDDGVPRGPRRRPRADRRSRRLGRRGLARVRHLRPGPDRRLRPHDARCTTRSAGAWPALGRRLVILQEGGYYVPALGDNARTWLRGAEGLPYDPRRPDLG